MKNFEDATTFVILESSDGQKYELSKDVVEISEILDTAVNEFGSCSGDAIPLPNIRGYILKRIVEFLDEYSREPMETIPTPIPWSKRITEVVKPDFYQYYILTLTPVELLETLMAADYLVIMPLIDLCSARLSRLLMNKLPSEILNIFGYSSIPYIAKTDGSSNSDIGNKTSLMTEHDALMLLNHIKWSNNNSTILNKSDGIKTITTDNEEVEPDELLERMQCMYELYQTHHPHQKLS